MRILILGSGRMAIGSALDLEKDKSVERITLLDNDQRSLDRARKRARTEKIEAVKADAKAASVVGLMKQYDVAIAALPHPASVPALRNAVKAGLSVVDMAFEPEQLDLDEDAKKAQVTVIPGFGVHPGVANVFAGDAYSKLDRTESIVVRCGGLPLDPRSPLNHRTAFNLQSAVGEYIKQAEIIEEGKLKVIGPMSEVERIRHPKLGDIECFVTGTGATLTRTLTGLREFRSKTVRWPGNVERMQLLAECGLLSEGEMEIDDVKTTPKEILLSILGPVMILGENEKELTYLGVEAEGFKGDALTRHRYELLDYYDEKEQLTSMQRTTGFPPAIAARMIVEGQIVEKGVVPPEKIFLADRFNHLLTELSRRGISISIEETSIKKRSL